MRFQLFWEVVSYQHTRSYLYGKCSAIFIYHPNPVTMCRSKKKKKKILVQISLVLIDKQKTKKKKHKRKQNIGISNVYYTHGGIKMEEDVSFITQI